MAGTNTSETLPLDIPTAPVIILVAPQLGENIGMCARAMLNCAVTELRIVNPRDGWPNPSAISASSGASLVIDNAKIFTSTHDAIADLDYVFATTARNRVMSKDIYTSDAAATEIHHRQSILKQKCGIMFGCERTGLDNDDIALANAILNIPLNPSFSSLNLAQAVLLTCHAWLSHKNPFREAAIFTETGDSLLAPKNEIEQMFIHLEGELEKNGFFRSLEQRPTLIRNIRNYFYRSSPTQQEVQILHGIIASLTGKRGNR